MDFHLKQPIEKQQYQEDESDQEEQPSPAKFPRLLFQLQSHPQHQQETALPLFAPPQQPNFSAAYPDSKPPLPPPTSTFPCRVGGYFSTAQWQELEVQALIFRHMVAGASVPPQLLQLVKNSLLNSPSYHLNSYYHPALYQTAGSWGKANMDPEPGRCRRTDGKKWRCSRDVVTGHKYCERHVHRGRNRSRKPVESCIPTAATAASMQSGLVGGDGTHFSLSGPTSSLNIFQHNEGAADPKPDGKSLFKAQNDQSRDGESKLRLFFDERPRSDNTSIIDDDTSTMNSATCLTISTPGEKKPSVDFLKLSTGNERNQVDSMGGPLAEALRSSTGASSTGVLHQLPQSASGTSCVTA